MLRYAWALLHFVDRASTPSITGECQCSGILFYNRNQKNRHMKAAIIISISLLFVFNNGIGQTREFAPYVPSVDVKAYGEALAQLSAERKEMIHNRSENIDQLLNRLGAVIKEIDDRAKQYKYSNKTNEFIDKYNEGDYDISNDNTYKSIIKWIDDMKKNALLIVQNESLAEDQNKREAQEQAEKDANFNMEGFKGLLKDKKYDDALSYIEKFTPTNQSNSFLYFYKGFIYSRMGKYEEAISNYSQAIKLNEINNKRDYQTYYYRAYLYKNQKFYKEAISDFTTCINNSYKKYSSLFDRAMCKSALNDEYGAIHDYDEIINNESEIIDSSFLMGTVYNNKAYSLFKIGSTEEALALVNKALIMSPNEGYIWSTRGEIYYKKGNYKGCISDMEKDIDLTTDNKTKAGSEYGIGFEYYFIGMSYLKLGNKKEGCINLSKAGENGYDAAYTEIKKNCK